MYAFPLRVFEGVVYQAPLGARLYDRGKQFSRLRRR
jgi:hypothetical protein